MSAAVSIVLTIVYVALLLYFLALWARFILDLVQAFSERWRPRGIVLVLAEASYTVTDPAMRLVRRVVPPMRIGALSLDFGFTILMLLVIVLMYVVVALQ